MNAYIVFILTGVFVTVGLSGSHYKFIIFFLNYFEKYQMCSNHVRMQYTMYYCIMYNIIYKSINGIFNIHLNFERVKNLKSKKNIVILTRQGLGKLTRMKKIYNCYLIKMSLLPFNDIL